MTKWYEFRPADTLFFKGSSPMNAGQDHTSTSMFPPMPETIQGAIRTAVLGQNRVEINDYYNKRVTSGLINAIGRAGESAPFAVVGPLMKRGKQMLIPVPATWFLSEDNEKDMFYLVAAKKMEKNSIQIESSMPASKIMWAKQPDLGGELKPASGLWMPVGMLNDELKLPVKKITAKNVKDFADESRFVITMDALVDSEPRTGIAMDPKTRGAQEHYLYSFTHVRFRQDVGMVFGIDQDISDFFKDSGVLQVGGEQRFGHYDAIVGPDFYDGDGLWMALSPVRADANTTDGLVACGKIRYTGGWDMKKGFHKPLTGYYPQGSVFNRDLGAQTTTLKGEI